MGDNVETFAFQVCAQTIPIARFELNCFLEAQFLLIFNFTIAGRDRSADVPDHQHLLQVALRVFIVLAINRLDV